MFKSITLQIPEKELDYYLILFKKLGLNIEATQDFDEKLHLPDWHKALIEAALKDIQPEKAAKLSQQLSLPIEK